MKQFQRLWTFFLTWVNGNFFCKLLKSQFHKYFEALILQFKAKTETECETESEAISVDKSEAVSECKVAHSF